jgi:hypothetical protein
MSTYLNGLKRAETVIDDRPGNLSPDAIEKQMRFAKDLGLSKLGIHLCHLEKLLEAYREKINQPKQRDWRQGFVE